MWRESPATRALGRASFRIKDVNTHFGKLSTNYMAAILWLLALHKKAPLPAGSIVGELSSS